VSATRLTLSNDYVSYSCSLFADAVSDKVTEATSGAQKEGNKAVAKDSNADASTRATAAKDAVGNKMDETKVR
jgi:hypothetical protein